MFKRKREGGVKLPNTQLEISGASLRGLWNVTDHLDQPERLHNNQHAKNKQDAFLPSRTATHET